MTTVRTAAADSAAAVQDPGTDAAAPAEVPALPPAPVAPGTPSKPPEPPAPPAPEPWSIESARTLYNVEGWGQGFFDVNEAGHVVVRPDRGDSARELDLYDLALDLEAQGVDLPLLLRFSDILKSRIDELNHSFAEAIREFGYEGGYTTVFPIKVNQQRHVIEEIVEFGKAAGVGLECGSKPELQAILGLAEHPDHLIVCNGYKDHEFMRLALMAQKLGHQVFIVLEQVSEVEVLLEAADELGVVPTAGVRIKLFAEGSGRWAQSGGERSKFGLSTVQLMKLLDKLRAANRLDVLRLIHFHLGSQITDIRYIKAGLQEIARFYVELRALGVDVTHVDVGGGLGVDYDGTNSTSHASVNYSLQEYANDVVYTLADACKEAEIPMPHVISESGRALTAHHALLLLRVIDVESQTDVEMPALSEDDPPLLHEMASDIAALGAKRVGRRKLRELYHDAAFAKERAQELFKTGVLSLRGRALAEQLYLAAMNRISTLAQRDRDEYEDMLEDVEAILVDRYFCNFSLFQSLPDSWAIDQIFPVMPIHRLDEEPTRRGTIQDVTCDSDGKIDRFIGWRNPRPSVELHPLDNDEPYVIGIFLTGAYQEILGDLHNLFGDTNAVHIRLSDGGYDVTDLVHGDTVTEVLAYVQFKAPDLLATFRRKVTAATSITRDEANAFIAEYLAGLEGYTYLEGEAAR